VGQRKVRDMPRLLIDGDSESTRLNNREDVVVVQLDSLRISSCSGGVGEQVVVSSLRLLKGVVVRAGFGANFLKLLHADESHSSFGVFFSEFKIVIKSDNLKEGLHQSCLLHVQAFLHERGSYSNSG